MCAYRPFFHQRRVEFSQNQFQIADEIEGPSGEHDIEQFWHFAVEPRELSQGRWAIGDVAEFSAEGGIVEQSWRSRCFATKEPAWTIVVRRRAELPLTLYAWLYIRS
jgi:hypothetical protein